MNGQGAIFRPVETMADRIRAKRKEHRWSLRQLGDKVHRTHGAVNNWENGRRPSDDDLERLAKVFNVSIQWLRDGADAPTPPPLDADLLERVILGVERAAVEQGIELTPEKRAGAVSTLYPLFMGSNVVDMNIVRQIVKLAA